VPIYKLRPLRSPVAFSCHQRTSGRFLLGEAESPPSSPHQDWGVGGISAPSKTKWGKKTCIKTVN